MKEMTREHTHVAGLEIFEEVEAPDPHVGEEIVEGGDLLMHLVPTVIDEDVDRTSELVQHGLESPFKSAEMNDEGGEEEEANLKVSNISLIPKVKRGLGLDLLRPLTAALFVVLEYVVLKQVLEVAVRGSGRCELVVVKMTI